MSKDEGLPTAQDVKGILPRSPAQDEQAWCQPMDNGKHTPRKFLLYFDDPDRGMAVFTDETEAREAFSKANTAWNCYLFGALPLAARSPAEQEDLTLQICFDKVVKERDQLRAQVENASAWQPIVTAPKSSKEDYKALSFIGWCPDDTAPDGGDQRIVWWEPRMKNGAGCWWGDRDLEENPTHWKPLGPSPALSSTVRAPE